MDLGFDQLSTVWIVSSLAPRGVLVPDVKMGSSCSPEWEDPASWKSCRLCVPSTVVPHDGIRKSACGSVWEKGNIPACPETIACCE